MNKLLIMIIIVAATSVQAAKEHWKLGLQCWTFNHKTLMETADYCRLQGIHYLEIYPGQRIGGGFVVANGDSVVAQTGAGKIAGVSTIGVGRTSRAGINHAEPGS